MGQLKEVKMDSEGRQEKLDELVKEYIDTRDAVQHLSEEEKKLCLPYKPTAVEKIGLLDEYENSRRNYEIEKSKVKANRIQLMEDLRRVTVEIARLIEVNEVWVKSGDYAVGVYADACGGMHSEVEVRDWSEDLPELKDRLSYP